MPCLSLVPCLAGVPRLARVPCLAGVPRLAGVPCLAGVPRLARVPCLSLVPRQLMRSAPWIRPPLRLRPSRPALAAGVPARLA
jgi:hypothetical protein